MAVDMLRYVIHMNLITLRKSKWTVAVEIFVTQKKGIQFFIPRREYTESNSESESSSREDSVCNTEEQMIQSNQDEPEDLSLVRHSSCFTAVQDHSLVQDSNRNPPLPSRSGRSQGPIVLLGRSSYFTSLYKQVHTLTAIVQRYHYDLRFHES